MPKAVSNSAGAAQSSLITTVPYMQAPDHYSLGKAAFPDLRREGRSGLDVMASRHISERVNVRAAR